MTGKAKVCVTCTDENTGHITKSYVPTLSMLSKMLVNVWLGAVFQTYFKYLTTRYRGEDIKMHYTAVLVIAKYLNNFV